MSELLTNLTAIYNDKNENLLPQNLKQNVTCLGVTGTLVELKGQTKTVTPTAAVQTVKPDTNYNGLTTVTVNGDANLIPANIKEGVSIFNVQGTHAGSTGENDVPVKLFATEEDMRADLTTKEGDLAVVYGEQIGNMTAATETQFITFPATVTLPTAVTSSKYGMFRSADDSSYFDAQTMLNASYFEFYGYGESSNVSVAYSSNDGITYTRTDAGAEMIDCGVSIKCYHEDEWDDAFGYFMQASVYNFGGLYEYQNVSDDNWYDIITNYNVDTTNKIITSNNELVYLPTLNTLLTKFSETEGIYNFAALRYNNEYYIQTEIRGTRIQQDITNNKKYSGEFTSTAVATMISKVYKLDLENSTYTHIEDITSFRAYTRKTNTWYNVALYMDGDIVALYMNGVLYDENEVWVIENDAVYEYNEFDYSQVKIHHTAFPHYTYAPTQLSLNNANQILSGKIGYGSNGVVVGDGSIYDNLDMKLTAQSLGIDYEQGKKVNTTNSSLYEQGKLYNLSETDISVIGFPAIQKEVSKDEMAAMLTSIGATATVSTGYLHLLELQNGNRLLISIAKVNNTGSYRQAVYGIFDNENVLLKSGILCTNENILQNERAKIAITEDSIYVVYGGYYNSVGTCYVTKFNKQDGTILKTYSNTTSCNFNYTVYVAIMNNRLVVYGADSNYPKMLTIHYYNENLTSVVTKSHSQSGSKAGSSGLGYATIANNCMYGIFVTYPATNSYISTLYKFDGTSITTKDISSYGDSTGLIAGKELLTDGTYLYMKGNSSNTIKIDLNLNVIATDLQPTVLTNNTMYVFTDITDYLNYTYNSVYGINVVENGEKVTSMSNFIISDNPQIANIQPTDIKWSMMNVNNTFYSYEKLIPVCVDGICTDKNIIATIFTDFTNSPTIQSYEKFTKSVENEGGSQYEEIKLSELQVGDSIIGIRVNSVPTEVTEEDNLAVFAETETMRNGLLWVGEVSGSETSTKLVFSCVGAFRGTYYGCHSELFKRVDSTWSKLTDSELHILTSPMPIGYINPTDIPKLDACISVIKVK